MFSTGFELSIVVPTFNEKDSIVELIKRLEKSLIGIPWEIIFVDDDSPDQTHEIVRTISQKNARVRCIQRIGRRGLASACIEGMLSSSAPYIAIMDADLQHDESLLSEMLDILKKDDIDVVVGSRYTQRGGIGSWNHTRLSISRLATRLSRLLIRAELTDPMSGFFMIRRKAFADCVRNASGIGFKILLDLFASSPRPLKFKEVPYQFRNRLAGESKLDSLVAWEYIMLLLDKTLGKIIPVRFISFSIVGGLGILVHFLALSLMFKSLQISFVSSQIMATLLAMTFNFAINNILTYRDMRLTGLRWLYGWLSFILACSIGAISNVGIASYLFEMDTKWFLAGLAGIFIGAVWNYTVTMVYTWNTPRTP